MLDKWRQARKESQEMNLLPVMNLMVILIPALMLGAAFYHLGNIPTSIPDNVPASSDQPQKKDPKVTVYLKVMPDHVKLEGVGEILDKAATLALDKMLPNVQGKPDLKGIQAHLMSVKTKYPKSDTVWVLPDPTVKYAVLVDIMDVSRERKLGPGEAKPGKEYEPLFPKTVFSKPLIAAPDEADAGAAP